MSLIKSADGPEALRQHEVARPIEIEIPSDGKMHILERLTDGRMWLWSHEFKVDIPLLCSGSVDGCTCTGQGVPDLQLCCEGQLHRFPDCVLDNAMSIFCKGLSCVGGASSKDKAGKTMG